jgi:hypothetical protein
VRTSWVYVRDSEDVAAVVPTTFGSPSLSWEVGGRALGMLKERAMRP